MRNLFGRATDLFWQHRTFWLPVILADFMGFLLLQLQHWLVHSVVPKLTASHSVLSNNPIPVDLGHAPLWVRVLTVSIAPLISAARLSLYVGAMMTTFVLVRTYVTQQIPALEDVAAAITESWSRIVFFALKILVCAGVVLFLVGYILLWSANGRDAYRLPYYGTILASSYHVGVCLGVIGFAGIAYILAPGAIRLLNPATADSMSEERFRLARICAALTQVAVGVVFVIATFIGRPLITGSGSAAAAYVIEAVLSLCIAVPYILLFIALSLLASGDAFEAATVDDEAETNQVGLDT